MANVTRRGESVDTCGDLPAVDTPAPNFSLVLGDLSDTELKDYAGKRIILNIFPSIDTPTCQSSVRTFNEKAGQLENTQVLCVSADLPFAQARFCGAEGLANVINASSFRSNFGQDYGVSLVTGPLRGLLTRAVVVIGRDGDVIYTELVPEIGSEPDYDAAIASLT